MKLLIVDDSRTQRAIIKKIIGMTGLENLEMLEAGNGLEALEQIRNNKVDIIFTDINMPEMDGEEMIEILKSENATSSIPIVVLTSKGSDVTRNKLEEKGINAFLVKPFTPEDVSEILEELVKGV